MTIEAYEARRHYHYDGWGWDYCKTLHNIFRNYRGVKGLEKYARIDLQPSSDACQPFIDYSGVYLIARYLIYQDNDKHKLNSLRKELRYARNKYMRDLYSFGYREGIIINRKDFEESSDFFDMTEDEQKEGFEEQYKRIKTTERLGYNPWDLSIESVLKKNLFQFWDRGLSGRHIGNFRKKIGRQLWKKIAERFRMKNFIYSSQAQSIINCLPSKEFPVTLLVTGDDDMSYMKTFSSENECLDFIDQLKDVANTDSDGKMLDDYLDENMYFTN